VVLLLRAGDLAALRSAFPETDYYVPPEETLRLELARSSRGMFNLIHHASQFKADAAGAAGAVEPMPGGGVTRTLAGATLRQLFHV
jgi:hypothetical protein